MFRKTINVARFGGALVSVRMRIRSWLEGIKTWIALSVSAPVMSDAPSTSPSWVDPAGETVMVRMSDGERRDSYYCPIGPGVESFTVEPTYPFESVEFEIIGTTLTDRISVTATLETVENEEVTRETEYKSGGGRGPGTVGVYMAGSESISRGRITVVNETNTASLETRLVRRLLSPTNIKYHRIFPQPVMPSLGRSDAHPPILFISVDSLRNDRLNLFQDVIDVLGDGAIVPSEPRTQGHATQESHGSTFTSLHPGTHGLPHASALPTDIPTLPEYLMEAGYKCSACVSTINLSPRFGFGRGFHRFERQEMSWHDRAYDLESQIETVRRWMDRDRIGSVGNRFYFLHCFDAHYPYVPPFPLSSELDIDNDLGDRILEVAGSVNAIDMRRNVTFDEIDLDESEFETMLEYYDASVRSVATRLAGLFHYLDREGALEDAFVVVAGDHGEAFLERGSLFHNSLYDENIRPGLIVKPPASSDIVVPDTPDLIDLYPTVASLVGGDIPDHCQGESWNGARKQDYRVTERVRDHHYQLAVEKDGRKGIFTWEVGEPMRPDAEMEVDVSNEEFSVPEASRQGAMEMVESVRQDELREIAKSFVRREPSVVPSGSDNLPTEVVERLEQLGYR